MSACEPLPDGLVVYLEAYQAGLRPDPELWVDEWADRYMRIPPEAGAEPGKYRVARTPYAKEVMRALSPAHPARRVVAMVASQLFKTQVALNWVSACIAAAPANILVLLPTLMLAKRVSSRIGKTISEVPQIRDLVAQPRSRDARNTIDTKEFSGGTLYITTAGSAANLAEIPVRYLYGDEIDRWDLDVDGEGDPVELAETRGSTYGRRFKAYYTSTPTIEKASRIADLYAASDQRHYLVPCPECGHMQELLWERLGWAPDFSRAWYACEACGVLIDEHSRGQMLAAGEWRPRAAGDGETVGFHLSALYAPPGWVSWLGLAKQFAKASTALDRGDPEPMQAFYNTRLAKTWDDARERTAPQELQARAEDYELRTVPRGALVLTAAVDVQGNRLEVLLLGWGEGLERWVIDYAVLAGDPTDDRTWAALDEYLARPVLHACGRKLLPDAVAIDSGGHHTQEVYSYTRARRHRHVLAVKGAAKPGRPVIAQKPSRVDVTWRGRIERSGAELWIVGTDTAKDWIHNRMKLAEGPGAIHFSRHLPDDFYAQLTAERKLTRWVKGFRRTQWVKAKADRNEVLDLMVYALAMAQYRGLHRYREPDWQRLRDLVDPPQMDLLNVAGAQAGPDPEPAPESKATPPFRPRGTRSRLIR
jgi:phage terminase large subunit GpA-like protein